MREMHVARINLALQRPAKAFSHSQDPHETFAVATLALLNALFVAYNRRVMLPEAGMVEERVQRRLAAVLAADSVGYSGLMAKNGEGTHAALKANRTISDGLISGRGVVGQFA